jgi:HEAT repeat protein
MSDKSTNLAPKIDILDWKKHMALISEALNDRDKNIREYVIKILGEIRDRRAVKALTKALNSRDKDVRASAARALGKIDEKRVISS